MSKLRNQVEDKSQKPDFTLMPYPETLREVERWAMGARKYARDDWKNATLENRDEYYASLMRHVWQAYQGETDEDHLSAVIVQAKIIMRIES